MARFMEIKAMNPILTQKETANELGYSTSSLQRYKQDISMLSHYRIPPKSHKRKPKEVSNHKHEPEKPQMTPIDLERPQLTSNG